MDEPLDLNKKRIIPEVTYSVVENLGWDTRDKKQRMVGTITQMQFIDLRTSPEKIKLIDKSSGELLLECNVNDKYHQMLLEVGLNTILERVLEWDIFWESEHGLMFGKKKIDKEENEIVGDSIT